MAHTSPVQYSRIFPFGIEDRDMRAKVLYEAGSKFNPLSPSDRLIPFNHGFGSAASTSEINFSSSHASLDELLPSLTSTSFLDGIMMTLCSWNPFAQYASIGMEGQRRLAGFEADPAFSQNKAPYSPRGAFRVGVVVYETHPSGNRRSPSQTPS